MSVEVFVPDEQIVVTDVDPGPGAVTVVDVSPSVGFVVLGLAGLQGPPGPAGANALFKSYLHEQPTAATSWHIQHDLGYDPMDIFVVDNWGYIAEGWGVEYTTPGAAMVLTFQIPCAGTARLS